MIPSEALTKFSVAGTSDKCRQHLQAHVDAGVDKPVIEVLETDEEHRLALEVIREFSNNKKWFYYN